jgi:hypothetical protein
MWLGSLAASLCSFCEDLYIASVNDEQSPPMYHATVHYPRSTKSALFNCQHPIRHIILCEPGSYDLKCHSTTNQQRHIVTVIWRQTSTYSTPLLTTHRDCAPQPAEAHNLDLATPEAQASHLVTWFVLFLSENATTEPPLGHFHSYTTPFFLFSFPTHLPLFLFSDDRFRHPNLWVIPRVSVPRLLPLHYVAAPGFRHPHILLSIYYLPFPIEIQAHLP